MLVHSYAPICASSASKEGTSARHALSYSIWICCSALHWFIYTIEEIGFFHSLFPIPHSPFAMTAFLTGIEDEFPLATIDR